MMPPPHQTPTTDDDPRIGDLIGTAVSDPGEARVVLLGFPSDEGVRINGGRPGAAEAPDRIRRMLYRMTPDAQRFDAFSELVAHTVDLGDLQLGTDLSGNQERLGRALALHLEHGAVPIVLGGGHETAFAHFLGYVHAGMNVEILNWDAHADVRPLRDDRAHSGSPFRQAMEHPSRHLRRYTVAGLLHHSAAKAHVDFVQDHGGTVVWRDELTFERMEGLYRDIRRPTMVTFDVDAVDASAAPGVSAPASGGLPAELWLRAAYLAGRNPDVRSIDISECNPRFDLDGRTARLAAVTIWSFLQGLLER